MCDYQSFSDSHNTIEFFGNSYDGGTLSISRNDIMYSYDVIGSQVHEFIKCLSDETVKQKRMEFNEGMSITIKHQKKGIVLVECVDGQLNTLFKFNLTEMEFDEAQ